MAEKKPASRPVQAKGEGPGGAQSAAARRAAEAELRTLIAKFAPEHLRLVSAMRRSLRKWLPAAHEVVYEYRDCFVISFSPSERGYEGVLAIRASVDGIKLYFTRGRELPDPFRLLHGTARARWLSVERASTLNRPDVTGMIVEAIALNRTSFARAGAGSVIIRSVSAQPLRRRRPN